MGKRVKPVKAWGVKLPGGKLQAEAWPEKHNAFCATPSDGETVRVTVSLYDPRANRISAAERRVVAAAACYFNSENASARVVNACNLKNQVEALQRAKGGANG